MKKRLAQRSKLLKMNTRNPEHVAHAYTPDSRWRNRTEFFTGRQAIIEFLKRK
jgi:nuclear transport factor 2 (NTF2) superfamily protein